jgi:hypothetical protein
MKKEVKRARSLSLGSYSSCWSRGGDITNRDVLVQPTFSCPTFATIRLTVSVSHLDCDSIYKQCDEKHYEIQIGNRL